MFAIGELDKDEQNRFTVLVNTPEHGSVKFFISNGDEFKDELDHIIDLSMYRMNAPILVEFEPADQFAKYIPVKDIISIVTNTLTSH